MVEWMDKDQIELGVRVFNIIVYLYTSKHFTVCINQDIF